MLLRERALEAVELLPQAPRELADTIRSIGDGVAPLFRRALPGERRHSHLTPVRLKGDASR